MAVVLDVRNLTKVYKSKKGLLRAVDGVSFEVNEGEVVGIIGANGAGKSTTIKMIAGLATPTSGEVFICGNSVAKERDKALRSVGGVIESPDLYLDMTGLKNLQYLVTLHPKDTMIVTDDPVLMSKSKKEIDKQRVEDTLKMVGLWDRKDDLVRKYSLGMKQRLGIAQALLCKPKLLILDEPANGLDPAGIKYIRNLLRSLAKEYQMAILVSSHQLGEMQLMCDRVLIIADGKITASKNMSEMALDDSGKKRIIIKVDRESEAAALLKEKLDIDANADNGCLHAHTNVEISAITKELVMGGFNVFGVSEEEKKLEDVFMDATARNEEKKDV